VEMLGRDLLDRGELVDARVVDQDVEAAESLLRLGEEVPNVVLLGDVRPHGDCLASLGGDLGHDAVGPLLAGGVIDDHRGAFGRQVQGDRGPDPLGRAGDDRNFSIKLRHDTALRRVFELNAGMMGHTFLRASTHFLVSIIPSGAGT